MSSECDQLRGKLVGYRRVMIWVIISQMDLSQSGTRFVSPLNAIFLESFPRNFIQTHKFSVTCNNLWPSSWKLRCGCVEDNLRLASLRGASEFRGDLPQFAIVFLCVV